MFSMCNCLHFILLIQAIVENSTHKTSKSVIPEQSFQCNVNKSSQKRVFDAVGSTTQNLCRKMKHFGSKDDGRRVCMDDVDPSKPCIVFSLGSIKQGGFEEAIAQHTHCDVHAFDCTMEFAVPSVFQSLDSPVKFHKVCIGTKSEGYFLSWADIVASYGQPTILKMDIDGLEWSMLRHITQVSAPRQIAMGLHACTYFEKTVLPQPPFQEVSGVNGSAPYGNNTRYVKLPNPPREVDLLMKTLEDTGYLLIHRKDNYYYPQCSEILLRRKPSRA